MTTLSERGAELPRERQVGAALVAAPAGPAVRAAAPLIRRARNDRSAYLYLLPALILSVGFVVVPLLQTAWYSLHSWDGLTQATWVGFTNYLQIVADENIRAAVLHSVILIAFYSIFPLAFGLLFAAVLSRRALPGLGVFRTVLFLPQVVPLIVSGIAWGWMLSQDGVVNTVLDALGLDRYARAWFGDFTFALPAVGLVGVWIVFGFCMVLFIAGISKIDTALYDAARVDGAGFLREFFAVTLPGIRAEIGIALTITMIGGLRSFDIVYVTTAGGPGKATNVPALEVYQRAFIDGTVGSAAAVAISLTVLIILVATVLRRLFREAT